MKSLKYFLTALCLVAVVFAVCACDIPSNGVVGFDGIGNMLKNDYKQTKLVVDTTEGGVKLSDTFLVTKGEDKISVAVKLQRLVTFEQDDNGNIVVPSKQIKETIGNFDVVDGKVVNASQGLDVSELPVVAVDASGFNFSAECLSDVKISTNKMTASVKDVGKFVGVSDFDGKDMTVEVTFAYDVAAASGNLQQMVVNYVTTSGVQAAFTFTFVA